MGGNIFSTIKPVVRLNKEEYLKCSSKWETILQKILLLRANVDFRKIYYIRDKTSFGDLDILVSQSCKPLCQEWLESEKHLTSRNGNALSVYDPEFKFQVDLIFVEESEMPYAQYYFSWGIQGSLVGRLLKPFSIKHAAGGLYYIQRDPYNSCQIKEHLLQRFSYYSTLRLLKLDIETYSKGFNTNLELFKWLSASPYFNPEYYALENLNYSSRARAQKRPEYLEFLSYCDTLPRKNPQSFKMTLTPGEVLLNFFKVQEIVDQTQKVWNQEREVKEKFNGTVVQSLTALEGKALGDFTKTFKNTYPFEWLLSSSPDEIAAAICAQYNSLT